MEKILDHLITRIDKLAFLKESIGKAALMIVETYSSGGKVLTCGNGGSSSDAGHIVGELMKGFESTRPLQPDIKGKLTMQYGEQGRILAEKLQQGLPAISLSEHTSLITAISNDLGEEFIFAQQVIGYGNPNDTLLALSTSGNSLNVINAITVAKAKGMKTIGLTGENGGKMKTLCDIIINVPETRTAYVQELHLPIYHTLCMMVEKKLFS